MNMRILQYWILLLLGVVMLPSCEDDDSFSTSPNNVLTFSTDTVKLVTTFSTVPTATKTMWVYNRSGDGLRCTSVRLMKGNQTGFRVNVDGYYLGSSEGYQVSDVEIRNKDSIRVFVELTAPKNQRPEVVTIDDDLVFTLESGVQQKVHLRSWSWDAEKWTNKVISENTTIDSETPIIIYGGLTVEEGATLTIAAGTTLYFHNDAGINVNGTLITQGTAEKNVVLRGDRIDHMFDYLPYDRVSGQWRGITFGPTSFDNVIEYTDIHSTYDGVWCESEDATRMKLRLLNSTIHNCQGYGLYAANCMLDIQNTQMTNTLNDCACFIGGSVTLLNCTLAQFYPFDSARKAAIRFSNDKPLNLICRNSLITGYADDVLMGSNTDETQDFNFFFDHCVIRTPEITGDDGKHFTEVVFENPEDTTHAGQKHFVKVDGNQQDYDFHLSKASLAKDAADPTTSTATDHDGVLRDDTPDMGAYECTEQEETEKP